MPKCDYCGETFDDDDAHDEHLLATHRDELGRIDRRRLDLDGNDEDGVSAGIVMLGAVMALALIAVGASMYLTSSSGGDANGPTAVGSVHYHGTINATIANETVDFSQPKYQYSNTGEDAFHFEGGDGSRWHAHAKGVTLAYAMDSLGIQVNATSVTYEGTTYTDADANTTVTITVNGEPVTPSEYVLEKGDDVRIVVKQS
ncbi:MAG: hypothetical protein ABEH81_05855 [Halopenitus sp.]